jgi:hypothetical protein
MRTWHKIDGGYQSGRCVVKKMQSQATRSRDRRNKGITKAITTWAPYVDGKYVGMDEDTLKDAKDACERHLLAMNNL